MFNFQKSGKVSIEPIINDNIIKIFENSLLFYTNIQRSADLVLLDQKTEFKNNEQNLLNIKNMGIEFYNVLCERKFNIVKLGGLLHKNWLSKKALSNKISNDDIDQNYSIALKNGALGGKILGAGGGGFIFFIAPKSKHEQIIKSLANLKHVDIDYEPTGTRTLLKF